MFCRLINKSKCKLIQTQKWYFTLSDKYYKVYQLPLELSETLKNENETEDNINKMVEIDYSEIKKELFLTPEKEKSFLDNKKQKFTIPRPLYKNFLEKGMLGDAVKINFKDKEIYLIGTMYERVNPVNLYRLLNLINPEMILLQLRPDRLLSNINEYFKKDTIQLDKLIREPWEIQPSLELKDKNRKLLLNQGFLLTQKLLKTNTIQKSFKEINDTERLTNDAISIISLWGEQKETSIMLSDYPERYLLETLGNKLTLLQIREMFDEIFIQFPNNPDWEPRTSLNTASHLFPDTFIHYSDLFISHSINAIAESNNNKDVKKIVAFVGYGQTKSLPLFLNYDLDRNNIDTIMNIPMRYTSLISGEDTLEVLVEKWVLLAIITNGIEKSRSIKSESPIINELIRKYARDDIIKTGFNSESYVINRMKYLFDQLMTDKSIEAMELIGEGYELKKKTFMRKIYDDPVLNTQLL